MSLLCLLHCLLKFVVVEQDPRCVIAAGRPKENFLLSCPPGETWRRQVNLTLSLFRLMRWWREEEAAILLLNIFYRVPILKGHGKIPSHAPFSFTTQVNQVSKYWLTIAPRQGGVGCMMRGCSTPRATFWWRLIRLQPLKMAKVV